MKFKIPLSSVGKTLVFVAIVASGPYCFADVAADCPSVRLDEKGGAFDKIPVYDQIRYAKEDPSLCYAVTGSELIDAYRYNHGESLGTLTSPLSLALNYKSAQKQLPEKDREFKAAYLADQLGPGSIHGAIDSSSDAPVCEQNFLQKYANVIGVKKEKLRPGMNSPDNPTTRSPEKFFTGILDQIRHLELADENVDSVQRKLAQNQNSPFSPLSPYFECRVGEGSTDAALILKATKASIGTNDETVAAQKFLAKFCEGHSLQTKTPAAIEITGFPGKQDDEYLGLVKNLMALPEGAPERAVLAKNFYERFDKPKRNKLVKKKMNELLNGAKPQPIGIGYCADVLKGSTDCLPSHASVVVGRRFNSEKNQCELLVRNSYGPSCVNKKGAALYAYPCENGSVWVPTDTLIPNTESISWIPQ